MSSKAQKKKFLYTVQSWCNKVKCRVKDLSEFTSKLFDKFCMILYSTIKYEFGIVHFPSPRSPDWVCVMSTNIKQTKN